ncbi:uncharacterized protein LOC127725730 isoform X10 [Mytilus californianus]|uniref:uncharacterized protein LOC127725730 isoform X10 n=1 Tax=Mytilus californianus TaxID=6549 RepID=UPI0022458CF1|nr:uncharacterized protein LOC127725730 isoform X10 [Mytilus californianus]
MTTSQGILFHGQVDDGNRKIHLKVFGPERMNCLLLFVRPDIPSISGVTLIADVTVNEHDLPMTFVSGSGSGYYYCLEMYGLKEEKDMKEHYTCLAYGGTQFLVAKIKNGKDIEISIRLKEAVSLQFPLRNNAEVIFPIQVYHRPVSRYSFCNNTKFKTDKIWIIFFKQSEDRLHVFIHVGQKLDFRLPFDLPVATICEVKVIGCILFNKKMRTSKKEMNSKMINFKTCFTKAEYETLYNKTIEFIKTRKSHFRSIEYFYRNKSEKYFASITEDHNGIMKPYKKDHNGDPCSIINGRLDGLFFSTAVDFQKNQPFKYSPFGQLRLHITARFLFIPNLNLYFADFYCHYKVHCVTVILTRKEYFADNFCKARLKKLDIHNNPFVCLKTSKKSNIIQMCQGNGLRIEVLNTEALNIHEIIRKRQGHFKRVPIMGRGESRPNGIPKNENCKICNL